MLKKRFLNIKNVISILVLFKFVPTSLSSLVCVFYIFQTMQYALCTSLEKSPQTNPIIGRIECKAGHGAGRPTQKMVIITLYDRLIDCIYVNLLFLPRKYCTNHYNNWCCICYIYRLMKHQTDMRSWQ